MKDITLRPAKHPTSCHSFPTHQLLRLQDTASEERLRICSEETVFDPVRFCQLRLALDILGITLNLKPKLASGLAPAIRGSMSLLTSDKPRPEVEEYWYYNVIYK